MMRSIEIDNLTEADVRRLADEAAFLFLPGDTIGLEGDLGSGKSTFARALIRSLAGDATLEVPSPTFTLVQSYETPRFEVAHFDLYRLTSAGDLDELDLDAALKRGIALIEWPARGENRIAAERFSLSFRETTSPELRTITLAAPEALAARLDRFAAIRAFLQQAGWGDASTRMAYLQGDASARRYARLITADGQRAVLVDSPRRPDGPPIRDGKPYSAIAHLAEDVRAFVAVGSALGDAGFSTPQIFAHDLDQGLLLIEDLGDQVFSVEVARGAVLMPLWQRATDTLVALKAVPPPSQIALPDGTAYAIPNADADVLDIETQLLLDWYWPALHGASATEAARDDFTSLWQAVFARVLRQPKTWLLRDFHSPNLLALDDRTSPRDIGIIDFQDAMLGPAAYDLVSLLQDARVDVVKTIEDALLDRYLKTVTARDTAFDANEFKFAYAALGAQRNTKILGIFARLAMRDNKRQYLAHMPRIWGYLERDLAHEDLAGLAAWYNRHLPPSLRRQALKI